MAKQPGEMTQSEYARHRGVTPAAIAWLISHDKIPFRLDDDGTKLIETAVADFALGESRERALDDDEESDAPDLATAPAAASGLAAAKAEHYRYQAKTAELTYRRKLDELVEVDDVKSAAARCGEKIKAAIVGSLVLRVEEIVAVAGKDGINVARMVAKTVEREVLAKVGYRSVAGKTGEFEIDEDQAAVIRRIFQEYVAGRTPRDIARDLTREGIPSPRGGRWAASTINGNTRRLNGILQNPLYVGRIVWNRLRMDRDPDTGRRVPRLNPKSAWHERNAPHFTIVDHELFDLARRRKAERSQGHPVHHKRPRHILSGLLRCGACGGGMSVSGRDKSGRARLYCTASRESGTCTDPKTFYLVLVEEAVLSGLRRELKHPAVIAEYVKTYAEERSRLAQRATKDRARLERSLSAANRALDRARKAFIEETMPEDEAKHEMDVRRAERNRIKAELAAVPVAQNVVTLHPTALRRYEEQLSRLQESLAAGSAAGDIEAAGAIRHLVEAVTVRRDPERRGGVQVEIAGRLNALLGEAPSLSVFASVGKMVAGAGIEPATYGL